MKMVSYLVVALLAAGLAAAGVMRRAADVVQDRGVLELIHAEQAVRKRLDDLSQRLSGQLNAFGRTVAGDRDFSMKLVVEQDTSAAEVAGVAGLHMGPMGLDLLEISTSEHTVLSSGHFAARAGGSSAEIDTLLGPEAVCVADDIRGERVLSIQVRTAFTCADMTLGCRGGVVVNRETLSWLSPRAGVTVVLRQGDSVTGLDSVETISAIEDGRIIVNDVTYLATAVPLSSVGIDPAPELIVLTAVPARLSLRSLL